MIRLILFLTSFSLFSTEYIYLDGSANQYTLFQQDKNYFIKYEPIKKENSSSGVYSGGEEKKVSIPKEDYISFIVLFKKAFLSKEVSEKREMMTGMVIKKKRDKVLEEKILLANSHEKHKLERSLKQRIDGFIEK